jgi:hypothetical protein
MRVDPLVEEAREAGQHYIDSFRGDWKALIADLERRAREEGREIRSLPPKRIDPQSRPSKRAG